MIRRQIDLESPLFGCSTTGRLGERSGEISLTPRRELAPRPSPKCLHDVGGFTRTREDTCGQREERNLMCAKPLVPKATRHQPVRNARSKGSNPAPATITTCSERSPVSGDLFAFWAAPSIAARFPFSSIWSAPWFGVRTIASMRPRSASEEASAWTYQRQSRPLSRVTE
jgi:hypothetical protein